MAASVQRALEVAHVCILLWIYPWVGEQDWQILNVELHIGRVVGLKAALGASHVAIRMARENCTRLCVL